MKSATSYKQWTFLLLAHSVVATALSKPSTHVSLTHCWSWGAYCAYKGMARALDSQLTSMGASAAYSECSVTKERPFLLQNRKDEQMIKRRNMPQMPDEAPVSSSIGVKAYDPAYISQLAEVRLGPQDHPANPGSTV